MRKAYIKWSPETVIETVNLVQKHGIEDAAKILGLATSSVRINLWRKGVSLYQLRQRSVLNKRQVRGGIVGALVQPSENRPFAAMAVMEADIGGCRWPIGDLDKGNFRFCSHEKARGSFCKAHAPRAYIGEKPVPVEVWLARYEAAERAKRVSKWRR